jgi:RNA polymerase sigma-70 factor, ECF subfamily
MAIRGNIIATSKIQKLTGDSAFRDLPVVQISYEERDLIRRLREGDERAFETLVREFAPRMLSVARRFLPERQDAQDVVQNALMSAIKAIRNFAQQSQLSTWLHRIVVNASLMELRSRHRRVEDSIEDLLPRFDHHGKWYGDDSNFTSLDQLSMERRETRELVRRSIAKLPESYRIVLLMRDIEDLDIAEIAQMLNASTNAIKVRIHRARQALRAILKREIPEGLAMTTN